MQIKRSNWQPMRWTSAMAVLAALALPACDSDDKESSDDASDDGIQNRCAMEDRAEDYEVGLEKHGEHTMVRFVSATPSPPVRGDNVWTIAVMSHDGAPMDEMSIDVNPWMPDHNHGSPVPTGVTPMGDGEYSLDPVNLFMAGYWEITMELEMPDGEIDDVMFSFCVD